MLQRRKCETGTGPCCREGSHKQDIIEIVDHTTNFTAKIELCMKLTQINQLIRGCVLSVAKLTALL